MKYGVFAVLCLALVACQGNTQEKISLKTAKDSVSYSIGLDIGRNLKRQSVEVESATLAAGIKAIMDSTTPMLTEAQVKSVMESYQARLMEKHAAVQKAAGDKNIAEGKKFLEENGKKEG